MRNQFALSVFCLLVGATDAFNPPQRKSVTATTRFAKKDVTDFQPVRRLQKVGTGFVAAATIFASSLVTDFAIASPANAELELSKGAFVVQTSNKAGQSLLKTEIDSQSLVKTLFKNRKALGASTGRIQQAIQDELKRPVWLEVQKELVDIEGDVLPTLKISPPSDITATLKDISKGKLNFLVNGEIVNIVVEPTFGEEEDDLIVRISGFKGEKLTGLVASDGSDAFKSSYGPIRTWLGQYEAFWAFWDEPYPSKYLLDGVQATNGQIILTGAATTVGLTYLLSYVYYIQVLEQEETDAAAKKTAVAAGANKEQAEGKTDEKMKKVETKKVGKKEEATPEPATKEKEKADTKTVKQDKPSSEVKKRSRRLRFWKKD